MKPLNKQLPVTTEVEVIDQVDDQSIIEMMTGQMNKRMHRKLPLRCRITSSRSMVWNPETV